MGKRYFIIVSLTSEWSLMSMKLSSTESVEDRKLYLFTTNFHRLNYGRSKSFVI